MTMYVLSSYSPAARATGEPVRHPCERLVALICRELLISLARISLENEVGVIRVQFSSGCMANKNARGPDGVTDSEDRHHATSLPVTSTHTHFRREVSRGR